MEYVVLGLAAVIIIIALSLFTRLFRKPQVKAKKSSTQKGLFATCPICSSRLLAGENIFSKVYRPMTVPDQRCTVSGCPHCYPKCEPNVKRICPVCHKEISTDGYLVARLFNKTEGKKHVMIIGCTSCMKGYSND